jgi:hypothetical protein
MDLAQSSRDPFGTAHVFALRDEIRAGLIDRSKKLSLVLPFRYICPGRE